MAASAWARIYCPEVSLGLVTPEEALDVDAVAVAVVDSPAPVEEPLSVGDVESVEPEPPALTVSPITAARARCLQAGLTDDGITALCQQIGEVDCLDELPAEVLDQIIEAGISPETVARCNAAAEPDQDPEPPAAWAA